jgi:YesN/AraC family two-component response regulator
MDVKELETYLNSILNKISQLIYENNVISTTFLIGEIFRDFMEVYKSYDQVMELSEYYMFFQGRNLIWHSSFKERNDIYYYPIEIEAKLQNYVKDNNVRMLGLTLDRIYQENFVKRNLSSYMTRSLISEMNNTVIKTFDLLVLDKYQGKEELEKHILMIDRHSEIDKLFESFQTAYIEICNVISLAKNATKTSKSMELIVEYINKDFSNKDLNMTTVADKFGFASAYLSRAFKEYTGDTFSSYVEKLRIEKSCELLINNKSIESVSIQVGYNNIYSFRKAFKKVKGTNPSEYKQLKAFENM